MYKIVLKSSVKKDLKKIKNTLLETNFLKIINQLKENPYNNNHSFEKLIPPIKGFYSRRINVQHRVVYTVNDEDKIVTIYSAYGHYE
ncbi:Txe/YoeB family addiction module toxin [Macrococcoides canis]|uniref:Txe/YoeB family addiction module toxin n=1 Tax=Macrococcoides canis TaxID=1855823 RepID=UPI001AEBEF5B|nr:Txe/YoeB family addiction module toxin [Macrococcus canis]QTQ07040.1 Txe/YoeB family addiction module toxin [Macrococcus canis]QUR93512.1 Txe/YoeB family addiction module toxin [Macrococcus canis]UTH05819.1 Txe/YoeB family addiction module toxin [Macrococcus canis]